jgi:hypothetical protein
MSNGHAWSLGSFQEASYQSSLGWVLYLDCSSDLKEEKSEILPFVAEGFPAFFIRLPHITVLLQKIAQLSLLLDLTFRRHSVSFS